MRIAVTGKTGQVVTALKERGSLAGHEIIALGRPELDLADPASVLSVIEGIKPDALVSAAAYTAVDKAESEQDLAFAVNAAGAGAVAQTAKALGVPLIHISTDYVFDGLASTPYSEQAHAKPLNVYGESKLQGEQWVLNAQPHALVVRTAWVYSAMGANFVSAMLKAAQRGKPLRVVCDQTGAPTHVDDLADAIMALVGHADAAGGLYHYCGATAITRYAFARTIFEIADRLQSGNRLNLLSSVSSSDYPSEAVRPRYSVLDCQKMAALGCAPKPLLHSLPPVVQQCLSFIEQATRHT